MTHPITILLAVLLVLIPAGNSEAAAPAPGVEVVLVTPDDCSSCGKTIYFGERCLTCIAKEAKANRSHDCAGCEKPILFGELCARCTYAKAKDGLAHKCDGCEEVIHIGSTCTSCTSAKLRKRLDSLLAKGKELPPLARTELARLVALLDSEDEKADQGEAKTEAQLELEKQTAADAEAQKSAFATFASAAAEYAKKTGKVIGETAENLELKERAVTVVGVAVETARVLEETKRKFAVNSFRMLGRVPVHTELGWTSLSDLATFKLLEIAPEMEGTDLAKDPAAVLASLVVADHMYLLMDLKLVATEDGPMSIVNYMALQGSKDPVKALAATMAVVSVRKIRAGQDLSRSIRDLARAIEVLSGLGDEDDEEEEEGAKDAD